MEERLVQVRNTLLATLKCGRGNCTRVVIRSDGPSAIKHPVRYAKHTPLTTSCECVQM